MKKMKTILIDDEPMALEVLKHMLSPYKDIDIVGSYTKHTQALEDLKKLEPKIVFLDIEMGDMNGLELAEIIISELDEVEIVFVTAYSQYAVDAFEVNAIDYLLKPIQEKRLSKAIERLRESDLYNEEIKESTGLKVYSFGGFQVVDDKEQALSWRTQKSKELFAFLWTRQGRVSSKDIIIDSIFPNKDIEKASTLLHTTIYQLRKSLEKMGCSNTIIYSEEGYQLELSIRSDLDDLLNIIEEERYTEEDIGKILNIYKGDFLEEAYSWGMELQQTYRHLIFKTLEIFARNEIEKEKFSLVLKFSLDKLYEIDPFNNSLVEMILDYYGKQGERVSLENFFNNYKKELWEEMDFKPRKEIINTYNGYME